MSRDRSFGLSKARIASGAGQSWNTASNGERFLRGWERISPTVPAILVYLILTTRWIAANPFWVGYVNDDAGYYLMSRNVWRYGAPVLDYTGQPQWSKFWSPAFPLLASPLGAMPTPWGILLEKALVVTFGIAVLVLAYVWMHRCVGLSVSWAAAATLLLGASPGLVTWSFMIMTDVPALAVVLAALVLMRDGKIIIGTVCLAVACWIRTADVVLLAAPVAWLLIQRRPREALQSLITGTAIVVAWTAFMFVHAGPTGYLNEYLLRDPDRPAAGTIGVYEIAARSANHLGAVLHGELVQLLAGSIPHILTRLHVEPSPLAVAVLALTVYGFWRRRLLLEGLMFSLILALAVLWMYDPSRFLLPLAPLLVGGVASALAGRGRAWTASAALIFLVALSGSLTSHVRSNPTAQRQEIDDATAAYTWIRFNAEPTATVLTYRDIQCYIYSGHPATSDRQAFVPGKTYIVAVPYKPNKPDGSVGDIDFDQELLSEYIGRVVFRQGSTTILLAEAASPRPVTLLVELDP